MKNKRQLSNMEVSTVCGELAYTLKAGLGYGEAFTLTADANPDYSLLLRSMAARAYEGAAVSEVIAESGIFPDYAVRLVRVGEASGRVDEALSSLSDYYRRRSAMASDLRSTLIYPAVLLLVMLAVIVVLLVYVLPIFNDVYAQFGTELTGIAGGLLAFGVFLRRIMPALIAVFALAAMFMLLFAASGGFRERVMALWQRKRGDRGLAGEINQSRFAAALSMGISSGMTAEDAISAAGAAAGDSPAFKNACECCLSELASGGPVTAALEKSGLLPASECRLLSIGMRSGSEEEVMRQIAERLADDCETAAAEKIARVEPAMVIMTTVVIGLILLAVMLPLMNIMSAIG